MRPGEHIRTDASGTRGTEATDWDIQTDVVKGGDCMAWLDNIIAWVLGKIVEYRWYLISGGIGYAVGAGFVGFLWGYFG